MFISGTEALWMEKVLLCNARKELWIPGGSKGKKKMQNMHISLSETQSASQKKTSSRLKDIINTHSVCHATGYMTFPHTA